MLNFEVEPRLLAPLVPAGVELDIWQGRSYVSLVGFMFLRARVLGLPIPFCRDFEEVNLRFYVRRKAPEGWRRGVVFIKELVPRRVIAWVARAVYNENYFAVPMAHRLESPGKDDSSPASVAYSWKFDERDYQMELSVAGDTQVAEAGSEVEFITEHYWGYCRQRDGGTVEYRVEHPRWRVWPAARAGFSGDAIALYGEALGSVVTAPPRSAFLANGSPVTVYRGMRMK